MTSTDTEPSRLVTDGDIQTLLQRLLKRANQRQVWLFFLYDDDTETKVVTPVEDYPGIGVEQFTSSFRTIFAGMAACYGVAKVIMAWERRGSSRLTPEDATWARAAVRLCAGGPVTLRAQLLVHDGGVSWLAPDDYA